MTVTYIDDFVFCPNPSLAEANDLVLAHHYSKRKASAPRYVGGLRDSSGQLVAACFFSQPPTRWSEPVLELSRLVRTPASKVPLTRLVAGCVCYIKQTGLCDLLVSFADNTQHHHGGVYQAASWNYHGARAPSHDGFTFDDGTFMPRRTAYDTIGTSGRTKAVDIWRQMGINAVPHFDTGKHLYWKAIGRSGQAKADRLGLKKMPYIKPHL